jgi:RimJ/RimL family protein N-acetyltransferase
MTAGEAQLIAIWQYDGDWSVYNLDSAGSLLDDLSCYHAVLADERLVGFCCTGIAARVPGIADEPGILDVGMGMDPALVGQGHGAALGSAVLSYLTAHHPNQTMRVVIQSWNARSLRLARQLGFADAGELVVLQRGLRVTYRVLTK